MAHMKKLPSISYCTPKYVGDADIESAIKTEVALSAPSIKESIKSLDGGSMTDNELANAFLQEWNHLEYFRKQCQVRMLEIAKDIHQFRHTLTDDMIEVLVDNEWKAGQLTRALADATAAFMRATKALDRNITFEQFITE